MGESISRLQETDTDSLSRARELARQRTREHQLKEKKRYDRRRSNVTFAPGQLVMVETSLQRKGRSLRFNPRNRGPFVVVRVNNNNTVVLRGEQESGATAVINVERLISIRKRPPHLLPPSPAAPDEQQQQAVSIPASQQAQATEQQAASDITSEEERQEAAEDAALDRLQPLRRSSRDRRPTVRLIETMLTQLFSATEKTIRKRVTFNV